MQYVSRAVRGAYAVAGIALFTAACIGGVGGQATVEDPIPQPTAASPSTSQTPSQLDIYRASLDPSVLTAMDSAYAPDGYNDNEMRMAEFLYTLTTSDKFNRYRRPGAEEQAWIIGKYPAGADESQNALLAAVYDLDTGSSKLYASDRMKLLESPLLACITPEAYGSVVQYNRDVLDFYTQCDNAQGIVITAGSNVRPEAIQAAKDTLNTIMNCLRPDVKERLVKAGARVTIIGANELLTDLPEFKKYKGKLTDDGRKYNDVRGWTLGIISADGEERILKLSSNQYPKDYNGLTHEFGHLINFIGIGFVGPETRELTRVYTTSMSNRLWDNTNASVDEKEFFAEMGTIIFGYHTDEVIPGFSNGINGPEELKAHDPESYKFLITVFPCFPE